LFGYSRSGRCLPLGLNIVAWYNADLAW